MLLLVMLLSGCKKTPNTDVPTEITEVTQATEFATTEIVTAEITATEQQTSNDPTSTESSASTETTESNNAMRPTYGIELPDDNW